MLLEGVEEVGDAATELQVSNSKLAEVEGAFATQKSEYERLKRLHAELEEKLEAAEIQIKSQSAEYRMHLQQKDVEISHLKARQSGLQEEVQKLQQSAQSSSLGPAVLPVTTASSTATSSSASFMSRPPATHHGFHGDDLDLSDVLWSQQEINRLSAEVTRLEGEVVHWRRLAQTSSAAGAGNGDQAEIHRLQRTIKELREEMSREVDEHQHELAAVQDAQRQKLSDITRRHREELGEYEERIEELEEQIHNAGGSSSSSVDSSKLLELQKTITSLQEASEQREQEVLELRASLEEAHKSQASLQTERNELQEENAGLLQNYTRLQASVSELQTRVQEQEGRSLQKAQLEHEIQGLRTNLADAEAEIKRLKETAEERPEEEVEHADILELNTIIGSLRQEKEALEQEKVELQDRLREAECSVSATRVDPGESEELEDLKRDLERRDKSLKAAEEERETLMSELEELDRQNQEATQHMISVKEQLSGQLKEAEAQLAKLTAELNTTKDQKLNLEQELDTQKDKMSQSAFTLNDLHMGKQQLEQTVKELKEKLATSQEQSKEAKKEIIELRKTLQEKEEELSVATAQLHEAGLTRERNTHRSFETRKITTGKRIAAGRKTLAEQAKQYQQTIDELTRARSMDATALQTEHEKAIKLNQEKEMEIAQLKRDIEQLASDHRDTNEMLSMTVAGQKQLTDLLQEKDTFVEL
ncbi:hypothetical protein WMY93_017048 [Mugilogobius chulae]|uniref:Thyroid receptor interacting protein 11 n=1 Tax=Mugilogobius chulae TaxID=88201 RepID=A0AAW0NMI8_9GOBI